jgi:threonine/homoserine/homoserine lactone efflux protein
LFDYLIAGIALGFVAGISPGPLLVLVITETIKYNRKEGIKMAIVPLLSDLPIVLLSILVINHLSNFDYVLGIISLMGAAFLVYLAYENIRVKTIEIKLDKHENKMLRKGIVANLLSPHPYLFWMLVGGPITIKAYNQSLIASMLFIVGFYIFIVGTKIAVAFLSDKSKSFLSSKYYPVILKIMGFILLIFSILLIKDGLEFMSLV